MSCGAFTEIQYVMNELVPEDLDGKRILDIGSGYGFFGWVLRAHRTGTPYIVGIEINPERRERAREIGMYDANLLGDVFAWTPRSEYDLIILSHVVEHLPKEEALGLIEKMKEFCRGRIIVTSPEGDTRKPLAEGDPPHDEHISIWREEDLQKIGFKTRHMRFSHRAGRVVCLFERFYFWMKRIRRGGVLVGWWDNETL
jgi:SAM-dependent methyltransferase